MNTLTHAAEAIDAEGCCDTGPAPLDEAEAMRLDYEEIVREAERESALLWWGIPVAAVLGAAWAYVETITTSCAGCL